MSTLFRPQRLELSVLTQYAGRRFCCVIYGLVDPRRPDAVAYVGRTLGHILARYFEHIRDGAEGRQRTSTRVRWLAELQVLRTPPGLVLIESAWSRDRMGAAAREHLAERESYWIADYKERGEAWVNQTCEIQWQYRNRQAARSSKS